MGEPEMRLEALRLATNSSRTGDTREIAKAAEVFFKFLMGQKPATDD